jgi:hypothetical protein
MDDKNVKLIKEKIVEAHKRGICDSEGNSIADENGRAKASPKKLRATEILINGKWYKV